MVPLRLILMGSLISVVSEGSEWRCPEFNDTKISCICDFPQTLRCSAGMLEVKKIVESLQKLPPEESVSLFDCTIQNATNLSEPIVPGVSLHGLVITSGELRNISRNAFFGLVHPLQALGLPNNQLESVPTDALGILDQLERLDLSFNKFSSLSSLSFAGLKHLKVIDLSHNRIGSVSLDTFAHMKNLTVLKLAKNRLTVPVVMALMKFNNLEEFDLSMNALNGPLGPTTVPEMPELKTLSLEYNQLTSVCESALKGVPKLSSLSLNHNQIDVLEDHAFKQLSSLRSLYLGSNRIVAISSSSLAHLSQLTELDLSQNFLRALTGDIILPLRNLRVLRLNDNDISMVESDTFRQNTSLEKLNLSDNPLNCDCNLVDFSVWLNTTSKLTLADRSTAVCMTPPHLENALLIEVPTNDLRCEEDDYDLLMQEGPSATHVSGAQIILRAFNFNGTSITLLWSVDTKAKSFSCDAIFVYEEMSAHEVLLTSTPLRCNSSEMADPKSLVVRLDLGSMQPFHRYRFCIVLLEDSKFTDEMQLVLGCSEMIPLIRTNHTVPQYPTLNIPHKIISLQANMTSKMLSVSVDLWNQKIFADSQCQIIVTVFLIGTLLARHVLNCTNPRISISGLPPGSYHVCASLEHYSATTEGRLQCIAVKDEIKPDVTIWLTVCLVLVSTFAFLVFYFVYRRVVRRSRLSTAHQCFLASNEFDETHVRHSRYVKLQTTANI